MPPRVDGACASFGRSGDSPEPRTQGPARSDLPSRMAAQAASRRGGEHGGGHARLTPAPLVASNPPSWRLYPQLARPEKVPDEQSPGYETRKSLRVQVVDIASSAHGSRPPGWSVSSSADVVRQVPLRCRWPDGGSAPFRLDRDGVGLCSLDDRSCARAGRCTPGRQLRATPERSEPRRPLGTVHIRRGPPLMASPGHSRTR